MIFLPNRFERYLSALRIFVSFSILKHGLNKKHLKNLLKIYTAEALLYRKTVQPANTFKLINNLLNAAKTFKPELNFTLCKIPDTRFLINKKIFSVLLLFIAKSVDFINISFVRDYLKITYSQNYKPPLYLINSLKAQFFSEIFTNNTAICIPIKETVENSVYIESDTEYIFDRFSLVNVIFENISDCYFH